MRTEVKPTVMVSQRDNFAARFGLVLRSSAVFWVKNSETIDTNIIFYNYWKFKHNIDVATVINLRNLNGSLVSRELVVFDASEVISFSPPGHFEGSVEIEVFSTRNLRIPYAAVMAVYETLDSISMVHSYSRIYSQHEIESEIVIPVGEEGCWTIKDDEGVTSFAVFHNGASMCPTQWATLRIRNWLGEVIEARVELSPLGPFETVKLEPKALIPHLAGWLDSRPGFANVSFELAGSFSRMLCGNRRDDYTDLQVTHSNFNYSVLATDEVSEEEQRAYMRVPELSSMGIDTRVIVYPECAPGNYLVSGWGQEQEFRSGEATTIRAVEPRKAPLIFSRGDGALPTRIVTGLQLICSPRTLAAECSLGVIHGDRPEKHSSWMLISAAHRSTIYWVDYVETYGGMPADAVWRMTLYVEGAESPIERTINVGELPASGRMEVSEYFPAWNEGASGFGYLAISSTYGGLVFYSSLAKNDSITIEHSF